MAEASQESLVRAVRNISDVLSRAGLSASLGRQFGGDRDVYGTLGYPKTLKFKDYRAKYERDGIGGTLVDVPAKTVWRRAPTVYDGEINSDEDSPFEEAFNAMSERLRLWKYFERVDRVAGIGNYGILLIGSVKAGDDLRQPLDSDSINSPDDIGYLAVYRQDHAEIIGWVEDKEDPRYNLPEFYKLIASTASASTGSKVPKREDLEVHWSRVLHVADDLLEDDVYGRPRLERVFNYLLDLEKIGGGSAEMFWLMVAGIWHANVPADVEIDEKTMDALEEDLLEAFHGLRRILQTRSVELERVGGDTPDPTGVFNVVKSLISAGSRIPQRILFGSERGELASTQDLGEFLGRMSERQTQFAEPVLVRAFIDRMIEVKALPEPQEGSYEVEWPSLYELTDAEMADIQQAKADAVSKVAPLGDATLVMSLREIREHILGLSPDLPDDFMELPDVEEGTPPSEGGEGSQGGEEEPSSVREDMDPEDSGTPTEEPAASGAA